MKMLADASLYSRKNLGAGIPADEFNQRQIDQAAASKAFMTALRGGPTHDDLIWNERAFVSQPSEHTRELSRTARLAAIKAEAELLRVYRDPCTRCGVRGDVGCRHR